MKDKLLSLLNVNRAWLFITVALAFKIFFFGTCMLSENTNIHKMYNIGGDAIAYVESAENFYKTGEFYLSDGNQKNYTVRMPSIVLVYYPLRLLFNQNSTLTLILILQTLLSAFSAYLLALLAYRLFNSKARYFYFVFALTCISSAIAAYNNFFYTESLAASFLIIGCYLLFTSTNQSSASRFVMAGFFITLVVFFRPFMLVVWAAYVLFIWWSNKQSTRWFKIVVFYGLAFAIIDGAWTIRNYAKSGRFIPLQTSMEWTKSEYKSLDAQAHFIRTFGFHFIYWDPHAQHTWFISEEMAARVNTKRPGNDIFPPRTFNGGLNMDSLIKAREMVLAAYDSMQPRSYRLQCDTEACRILYKFESNLRSERPFDYYFLNKVRNCVHLLNHPLGISLKSLKYPLNVLMVFIDSFVNYMIIITGLIGLFALLFFGPKNNKYIYALILTPAWVITLFSFIIVSDEGRYLCLAFPFLTVASAWFLLELFSRTSVKYIGALVLIILWLAFYTVRHTIKW